MLYISEYYYNDVKVSTKFSYDFKGLCGKISISIYKMAKACRKEGQVIKDAF